MELVRNRNALYQARLPGEDTQPPLAGTSQQVEKLLPVNWQDALLERQPSTKIAHGTATR
jgi:hypothetical protein